MKKTVNLIVAVWLLALSGITAADAFTPPEPLFPVRSALSENTAFLGDVNADQKVNLGDVIFVLKLMAGNDMGTVSPIGDVDGDGRIDLKEALYQLQTMIAFDDYLQTIINAYLLEIVTEQEVIDDAFRDMDLLFYLNSDTGPALKRPTIEFLTEGIDLRIDLGSYTPPEGSPEQIATVQALLYDTADQGWGYGVNRTSGQSLLFETPHGNDFSATYSLFIDGVRRISDGAVKGLWDTDPARGLLFHVTTAAGSAFLVGIGNTVKISTSTSPQEVPVSEGFRAITATDDIQEKASQVESLPLVTGSCPCPNVDMLAELQESFAKQGVPLTADHLNVKETQPVFACGDVFKATIRLGSDLEVLESHERFTRRIREDDFRKVEPAGYFRGAHYILNLYFSSWWNPVEGGCKCHFAWQLFQVRTGRILGARDLIENCGNLVTAFDNLLNEIETLGFYLHVLSDSDHQIPDCDDGNFCTWDAFDLKSRECVHRAKAASPVTLCDDGDLCTIDDKCLLGKCVGKPKACNDGNPCTADSCDPDTGQCRSVRLEDGTPCDDGDSLTENDACTNGVCKGTLNPDKPLPGVPFATGKPSFSPDPVTGWGETTLVSIPLTADTKTVAIRLYSAEGNIVVMTSKANLVGTYLAEIQTPWISASPGQLYLEFYTYAGNFGGAYSFYRRDVSRSETHYTVYQNDYLGHTIEMLSDIPIAQLTVQPP